MSKRTFFLLAAILLFSAHLTAQNFYFKGKEIDPNKSYIIILSNGTQTSGKILNVDPEKGVTIYFSKSSTYTYKIDQVVSVRDYAQSGVALGLGWGIPYGVLGGFVEFRPISYFSVCGGLGTTIFSGLGWTVGTKVYVLEQGYMARPFGSAYYGINGIVSVRDQYYNSILSERYRGFTFGGGVNMSFDEMRKHEILIELLYIINPEFYDRIDVLDQTYDFAEFGLFPVKFAIGYAYRF